VPFYHRSSYKRYFGIISLVKSSFKGIYNILATPFDEERQVDFESLDSLVEFQIKAGANGITILGVFGEVQRLSEVERTKITKAVLKKVDHRIPVLSGTGAAGTDLAILYSKEAQELGVDGLMIAPPRLVKQNDDAIFSYYSEISRHVDLPIVIQDEPLTYGVNLSPELIARLATIKNVSYIKLEDPPTPYKISGIKSLIGEKLGIFGGLGGMYAYEELSRGARGIMTGFAFPEILCSIYRNFVDGEKDKARELFYKTLPLIRYEAQPQLGLALRKEILRMRGAIRYSVTRPPATKLDSESLRELQEVIAGVGLANMITV
jgi:4-hydroxy-tetrahydrodipicolinate synthase